MRFIFSIFLIFCTVVLLAQNSDPTALRKQMAQIRQNTNWSNPDEAKKANEEIKKLSKQLMIINNQAAQSGQTQLQGGADQEMIQENAEFRMQLWAQIWESAKGGENADVDLAKPLRETIVKAYREDESPVIRNNDFIEKMNMLVIDLAMPGVEEVIDQMENYHSIKYLIVTSDGVTSGAILDDIMNKASNYPLESLYIINFGNLLNEIPQQVGQFENLKIIGLFNNSLDEFPNFIGSLNNLEILLIDKNPLSTLLPGINSCRKLKSLGISQTNISNEEHEKLKILLPECNILI